MKQTTKQRGTYDIFGNFGGFCTRFGGQASVEHHLFDSGRLCALPEHAGVVMIIFKNEQKGRRITLELQESTWLMCIWGFKKVRYIISALISNEKAAAVLVRERRGLDWEHLEVHGAQQELEMLEKGLDALHVPRVF